MNILALDVATKTGWCSNEADGVWDFKLKRDESSGMRLIRFKAKLQEIFKLDKPDLVVFEMTAGRYKAALIVQSELHGVLKETCEVHDIPYRSYAAKEIKKFATGNGNASKEKMVAAVKEQMDITPIDDNHADALWLWELATEDYKYA